jgi:general secretion pathway protein I
MMNTRTSSAAASHRAIAGGTISRSARKHGFRALLASGLASGPASGFTLLELLVAVAVFAIVAVVIYGRTGDVANQAGRLETRTLATWVAENALTAVQIAPRDQAAGLPSGRSSEQMQLGGRDWRVELDFVETSVASFRRVDVRVFPVDADTRPDAAPVASLTGFVGAQR